MTFNIDNYNKVLDIIEKNGGNTEIIAISKYHPKKSVIEAINHGIRFFGENKVQEAKEKYQDLKNIYPDIRLHFTGNLQTNKIKQAVQLFDVFHTVYKEKQLIEFSKFPDQIKKKEFLVQVNSGSEEAKGGLLVEDVNNFVKTSSNKYNIDIVGLMCIPPIDDNPVDHFMILKELSKKLKLNKLSMGMSADYKEAISCGSNYVRIGSLFFGERN